VADKPSEQADYIRTNVHATLFKKDY
jgi:hypothetical protein